jgi:hypothetical protein
MTDKCAQCGFVYDLTQAAAAGKAINERVGAAVAILGNREARRCGPSAR